MGCNTSKESVQPVEGEEKAEEQTKQQEVNEDSNKENCSKPSSAESTETAKATTPTTNSAKSEARLSNHIDQQESSDIKEAPSTSPSQEEIKESNSPAGGKPTADTGAQSATTSAQEQAEEEAAATKIQAVFRGHQTRQTMKQADNKQTAEPEPTREQLEAEFRADDAELCKAATTIQNSFRNHLKTKQGDGKDGAAGASGKQENKEEEEEELDIDLTDPDLNKAATKIQASFRGHKVRKETEGTAGGDQ